MRFIIILAPLLIPFSASAQQNVFPRMIGEWREMNTATTVIIKPEGSIFAAGSAIYGQIERTITAGGNFAYENDKARCSYDIVLLAEDTTASWGLKQETINPSGGASAGYCPKNAYFMRIETSEQLAQRKADTARRERERQEEIARRDYEERLRREQIEADIRRRREQQETDARRRREQEEADLRRRREQEEANRVAEEKRRYKQVAGECDRLAAAPNDKDKPGDVPGMPWKDLRLVAEQAVKACGEALKVLIDHPRLIYQMGRAAQFTNGQRALKLLGVATSEHNYPAAYDNLGSMYRDGKHTAQDIPKAMTMFRKGADLGDSGAMFNLGYMLVKMGTTIQAQEEGVGWIRKSADLDYEPAVTLLAEYNEKVAIARQSQQYGQVQQWPQGTYQRQPAGMTPEAAMMIQIFGGMLRGMAR